MHTLHLGLLYHGKNGVYEGMELLILTQNSGVYASID
jgi:hypothetical protein